MATVPTIPGAPPAVGTRVPTAGFGPGMPKDLSRGERLGKGRVPVDDGDEPVEMAWVWKLA